MLKSHQLAKLFNNMPAEIPLILTQISERSWKNFRRQSLRQQNRQWLQLWVIKGGRFNKYNQLTVNSHVTALLCKYDALVNSNPSHKLFFISKNANSSLAKKCFMPSSKFLSVGDFFSCSHLIRKARILFLKNTYRDHSFLLLPSSRLAECA